MKKLGLIMIVAVFMVSALAGCASSATPTAEATEAAVEPTTVAAVDSGSADGAALKVTGLVETETAWTEAEVKAMNVISVESTNKNGETKSYDGVLISDLLNVAKPKAEGATVVFVADDGYTAEIALADLMACTDCIVSFRDQGGFSTVLPGKESGLQVKGVVEIQVK